MIVYNYETVTTDLIRPFPAFIKHHDIEPYADLEDFAFAVFIRYMGIKEIYPDAEYSAMGFTATVKVRGVEVYRKSIINVDPTPIEIPDEDENEE